MTKDDRRPQNQRVHRRRKRRLSKSGRRKRRLRRIMLALIVAALVAVIALIVFLVSKREASIPIPDKTLMTVQEDGSIIYDEVTLLSDSYDASSLRRFAEEQVDAFNLPEGETIEIKQVKTEDNMSFVRMEYSSAAVYKAFTGYDAFYGTVGEAVVRGYGFEDTFVQVSNGTKVTRDEVMADTAAKVFIIRESTTVNIEGELLYVSEEGTKVSDGEVSVSSPDGNPDAAPLCYIIFNQTKENQ